MTDPALTEKISTYPDELRSMLQHLVEDPTTSFECVHGEDVPAVGIYDVPGGCVALPGVEVQPICEQHYHSDGSFDGMYPVVDLSVDGQWSEAVGEQPVFKIMRHAETGSLALTLCEIQEPRE